jgi:hypothetical protein
MKTFNKKASIAVAALVGGVGGAMLATPETYVLVDSVPGVATHRQCSPGDMICDQIRSREIYSGQGWGYTSVVDSQETLIKQLKFGGIGAVGLGLAAFGLGTFIPGKKSVPNDE